MPATYDSLATTTVSGSSTTSITFSSIPSGYTDLKIVFFASSNNRTLWVRFNGDTGTNYSSIWLQGTGIAANNGIEGPNSTFINLGAALGMSSTIPSLYSIDIMSYSGSTNKTLLSTFSGDKNAGINNGLELDVGLWRNTSAISTILLQCGNGADFFVAGSMATLYGILRA